MTRTRDKADTTDISKRISAGPAPAGKERADRWDVVLQVDAGAMEPNPYQPETCRDRHEEKSVEKVSNRSAATPAIPPESAEAAAEEEAVATTAES